MALEMHQVETAHISEGIDLPWPGSGPSAKPSVDGEETGGGVDPDPVIPFPPIGGQPAFSCSVHRCPHCPVTLDTQLSILSSRYSALDNVSEQINPHAFGPQPLDGSVDSRPIAVQLADDPPAVLTHIGAADVRHDVELFDHAGDDRLPHPLIRKRQLYPHADHRLPPGADVSDRSDSAPPPCSASLRFPERNPSRSRVT